MGKTGQALSRQQVRDFDRRAVQQWGVPALVLMENAGRNAAAVIEKFLGRIQRKERLPAGGSRGVVIVAGSGNNGGDGFVIARHLHVRGIPVAVVVAADPARMTPDAATNFAILQRLGLDIRVRTGSALQRLAEELRPFAAVVDALGGTGITGPLRGDLAAAVEQINAAARPVIAVDIPTGLDCDTGRPLGPTVKARLTVTMGARKLGFDAPGAKAYTGKVVVVDIGVPPPEKQPAAETQRTQRADEAR
jgi:hydroxyethylthiazole kinase-like uncharacterized protein yjeF